MSHDLLHATAVISTAIVWDKDGCHMRDVQSPTVIGGLFTSAKFFTLLVCDFYNPSIGGLCTEGLANFTLYQNRHQACHLEHKRIGTSVERSIEEIEEIEGLPLLRQILVFCIKSSKRPSFGFYSFGALYADTHNADRNAFLD
jgi:hypothetical protein